MTDDYIKVLLVDDEVDFLDTLSRRLRKRGLQVGQVHSGGAALESLAVHPVDVVVLDVRMPKMDGIATLREIKRLWPLLEVIMLTGHVSMEAAVEAMELGAFDYLMKPIDVDELVFKIQDASEKKRLHEKKIQKYEELTG